MKQLIFQDICLKLDDLRIPYTRDEKYIRVNTAFYDVGVGIEPKKVLYELSVFVDETSQSVSMYVKTIDEYLLASGSNASAAPAISIFRKVRHITYDTDGQSTVSTIDLGEVPNTVKNTAVKYGWKFRTALNLNKPTKKPPAAPKIPTVMEKPVIQPEPPVPDAIPVTAPADLPKSQGAANFLRRLIKRAKYSPKH